MDKFHNYSLDQLFEFASCAERDAGTSRADSRSLCRAAGEYYLEIYRRVGAEAFWFRIRQAGKREDGVRALLKRAGWQDPNPPPPKDPSDSVLRYVQGHWPRMSYDGQERFLSWLSRAVDAR